VAVPIYKPDVWRTQTGSFAHDPYVVEIGRKLDEFHGTRTTLVDPHVNDRISRNTRGSPQHRALVEIARLTGEWQKQPGIDASHGLFGPMLLLQTSVTRRIRLYAEHDAFLKKQKALKAFGGRADLLPADQYRKARIQGLSGRQGDRSFVDYSDYLNGPNQKTLHLAFAQRDIATKESIEEASGNYWLERADPLHRPWGHIGGKLFKRWYSTNAPDDFFTWIDNNRDKLLSEYGDPASKDYDPALEHILTMDRGVKYVDKEDRWRYRVVVHGGLLKRRNPKSVVGKDTTPLEPFSTHELQTVTMRDHFAAWVAGVPPDRKDQSKTALRFYSHKHKKDRFHHSSFLQGADVEAGGEWAVMEGVLFAVIDKTGHYKAFPQNVAAALADLQRQGLDLTDTLYIHFQPGNRLAYYMATDVVAATGDLTRCHALAQEPDGSGKYPWLDFVRKSASKPGAKKGLRADLIASGIYTPPGPTAGLGAAVGLGGAGLGTAAAGTGVGAPGGMAGAAGAVGRGLAPAGRARSGGGAPPPPRRI
jgi:hypothetical protein